MPDTLIVGLGNRGLSYVETRHNIGMRVVDRFARLERWGWKQAPGPSAVAGGKIAGRGQASEVVLAKPQTFMNVSGAAVGRLLAHYCLSASDLVVVCDDLDLPVGVLRIRARGRSGGHHGLESLVERIGHTFARVKIGIGKPQQRWETERYVLSRFPAPEQALIDAVVDRAVEALRAVLGPGGLPAAMSHFNARAHA